MGNRVQSYRDLEVWRKAIDLVTETYRLSRRFPKDEIYSLTSQIRRAATSIPANIAEGWGRNMTKEYVQFLRIARGSLHELETHLEVSCNLDYFGPTELDAMLGRTHEINKMLNSLIRAIEANGH
ncbi:MAG: four helix bundle protein [candidate division WOR-3 bacterium]